ncbi:MAG: Sigma-70 region 2 [Syntrophorhabdaceae bacterium PtaU1.Bin034]|jgi:RNA polymerase sigma factor (sigma-70 family)|nr:MAG: Sigma-70 region 2 [Syntrophorhabdaceae bacterium PtaU1.Bin034]
MNPAEMDPLVDISPHGFAERKSALTVSVSSLSQAVKATIPSGTKKYDTTQAVEDFYGKHLASLRDGGSGLYEKLAVEIYSIYRPRIIKIARKYRSLSPIFGEDDLQQEALIAILQALRKYRHNPDIRMKFSTYLEWSIRNIFQRAIGHRDKYVEIYGPGGAFLKTMSYARFIERKKSLEKEGYTYTTKKRFCYLAETLPEEDLEARLNETSMAPYEYRAYGGSSEEPIETKEAHEEAAEDGFGRGTPAFGSGSNNVLNLQAIDSLYRQWARSSRQNGVGENDPVVLRIYDLCRGYGEEMLQPFRNNGTSIDVEEARRSVLSAIRQGLMRHDNESFPPVPFSVSLRVSIRRSVQGLVKAYCRTEGSSHG